MRVEYELLFFSFKISYPSVFQVKNTLKFQCTLFCGGNGGGLWVKEGLSSIKSRC